MAIPKTVTDYLDQNDIHYGVVVHPLREGSSMETAQAAHVSGEKIAKGVVLKDSHGYVLAVVPATHAVEVEKVRELTDRQLDLAPEADLAKLFPDCATGAVPAVGPAYGLETIVDKAILDQPEIYFEAGDHRELLSVQEKHFEQLLGVSFRGDFSHHSP
jgi:Ala-tRNA(Pro) deacylase